MSFFNRKNDERIAALEEALYYTQQTLIAELRGRIDDVEGELSELNISLENAGIDDIRYDFDRADEKIVDLENRFDDLENTVEADGLVDAIALVDKVNEIERAVFRPDLFPQRYEA
jgi:predicted nuclease with TOPRIM domain